MVPFPFFRPDQGEFKSGVADNVILGPNGYKPRKLLAAAPGAVALAANPRGHLLALVGSGFKVFVADSGEIYLVDSGYDWDPLTASLAVPDDDDHSMTQYGVFLIGTNTADGMGAYNIATPAGYNAISGAPAARIAFQSNNQIVALGDGSNLKRLSTCAFGDHTNWTSKGAIKKDFNDGGDFTGGADLGGPFAVIMQQDVVRRMTWGNAGGGAVFGVEPISKGIGCVHPRSVIGYNKRVAFLSNNGFMMTDGGSVIPIGSEKVNNWFFEQVSAASLIYTRGAADHVNNIFWWWFGSGSTLTRGLGFDWVKNEWVTATESILDIFTAATPGYTLEDLDAFTGGLEDLPYSLDSRFWASGAAALAGITTAKKFGFFEGETAAATLETQTLGAGTSDYINMAVPLTDDSAATMQVGTKDVLSGMLTWSDQESILDDGRVPLLERGKWQRYRVNHAQGASWGQYTGTVGVDGIDVVTGGPR